MDNSVCASCGKDYHPTALLSCYWTVDQTLVQVCHRKACRQTAAACVEAGTWVPELADFDADAELITLDAYLRSAEEKACKELLAIQNDTLRALAGDFFGWGSAEARVAFNRPRERAAYENVMYWRRQLVALRAIRRRAIPNFVR